jgi:hypothetical protein
MSGLDHSAIEALLAVRALDGLDDEDVGTLTRELEVHGPCAECLRLEAEFAETAAALAASLDPVPVPAAGADRVLRGAEPAEPRDEIAARRTRGRRAPWQALSAIAAAFVLVVGGLAVLRPDREQPATTNWAQSVVHFEGAEGDLAMAYVPGQTGVVFWGENLPDPGEDMTYEIWMVQGDTAIPGGCVTPQDGRIAVYVEADVGTTDTMAVTVEPADCPAAPTGDRVLEASLA